MKEGTINEVPPIVLCFSGNDPSGGGGLSADILTLASVGCHTLPIITAVTIQDSAHIEDILPMDGDWVSDQARFILEDMPVKAFKIGLVGSIENMAAITEIVADYPDIPLVLDPFIPRDNTEIPIDEWAAAMRELLIPYAHIISCNSTVARLLLTEETEEESSLTIAETAQRLLALGCDYLLMSGTHENTPKIINTLYQRGGPVFAMEWDRVSGSFHGKGATLSAAIAGALAYGVGVEEAVKDAQEFTWRAINAGYHAGMGKILPDPLFWMRAEMNAEEAESEES